MRSFREFKIVAIMAMLAIFAMTSFARSAPTDKTTYNFLTQIEAPATDTVTAQADIDVSFAEIAQAMSLRTDNPFYSLATVERMTFLMPVNQTIGVPCGCHMQGAPYRYVRVTKDSPPECVDTCGPSVNGSFSNSLPSVTLKNGIRLTRFGPSWRG